MTEEDLVADPFISGGASCDAGSKRDLSISGRSSIFDEGSNCSQTGCGIRSDELALHILDFNRVKTFAANCSSNSSNSSDESARPASEFSSAESSSSSASEPESISISSLSISRGHSAFLERVRSITSIS